MIQTPQDFAAVNKRDDREYLSARGWKPVQSTQYQNVTWKDPYNAASIYPQRDAVEIQRNRDYWLLCETLEKAWRERDQWAAYSQSQGAGGNSAEIQQLQNELAAVSQERDSLRAKWEMQEQFNAEPREALRNEIGEDVMPGRSLYASALEVIRKLRAEVRRLGGQPTSLIRRQFAPQAGHPTPAPGSLPPYPGSRMTPQPSRVAPPSVQPPFPPPYS